MNNEEAQTDDTASGTTKKSEPLEGEQSGCQARPLLIDQAPTTLSGFVSCFLIAAVAYHDALVMFHLTPPLH